jgi:chromatin segregation and condensation protein Rec8/ScpA/Scc1 (kleisin family)
MITVAIDRFDGPLDLLLALVRRNQYPLDALPIAEITRQYLAYIKEASGADVELGGDFLETASWLVLLKSRAMLPQTSDKVLPARSSNAPCSITRPCERRPACCAAASMPQAWDRETGWLLPSLGHPS